MVKTVVCIVAGVIVYVFVHIFFLSAILSTAAYITVLEDIDSPNNTYSAMAICSDQGALGGDYTVYVRDKSKDIHLILGCFQERREEIWFEGDWDNAPYIVWADESKLLVNNRVYDVAEFLS